MPTRFILLAAAVVAQPAWAAVDTVPLPRPRPAIQAEPRSFAEAAAGLNLPAAFTSDISDCRRRLDLVAVADAVPRLVGPGICGGADMVRLKSVILADKRRVDIEPAPELRCEMAEAFAAWMRDDVAAVFKDTPVSAAINYDAYECRGRNRVVGAQVSEHGKGNAIDVRAFRLAGNKAFDPTDIHADRAQRETLRETACARFSTVLGPGSDGYHESHIHLDLAARRSGYRMCQWAVREPPKEPPKDPTKEVAKADIPLPQPRPMVPAQAPRDSGKRRL